LVRILLVHHVDRFFLDGAIRDPVAADRRLGVAKGHEDVVPERIRRLSDVGGRWIGLGVGVRVKHPEDGVSSVFRVPVGPEMIFGVDGVELGGCSRVPRRIAGGHFACSGVTGQQPTGFIRKTHETVGHHLVERYTREDEHKDRLEDSRGRLVDLVAHDPPQPPTAR
jgi:hypothetical protein